jgi:hypothetical protein
MVPLLSECLRFAQYLLRAEDGSDGARQRPVPAGVFAGAAKALFWTGMALLMGLGLARLG